MNNTWLTEKRKNKGLSQSQLATLVEVDRSYITRIENGRRPSVEIAQRIAVVLDFPWTKFFE
ncbi:hypothetical protein CBW65_09945 [Tumebacillus avium]|uniref:HTH cro/C1-type domain-containing protein n=1 Tax=Tumebacillus avium TaxID=1903704 RepID=A0A1Y0IMK0_9BACL|nr:helix-turn-helix transcriptional regulator [Tumebacillus avium]ARU61279.1 hypothetical protein CBW65_09945 [Tumebacillus avium]